MNHNEQMKLVSDYVHSFYIDHPNPKLLYHNLTHTREMVDACKKIAAYYQLKEQDYFVVCTAAWFHDTGYLLIDFENHETKSAEVAEKYLVGAGVSAELIAEISRCILATRMPQHPETQNEKIVCDADLYHLGTDLFKEKSKLLKKELEGIKNIQIDNNEWRNGNIQLLETHHYHTDYCRELLEKRKAENLDKLKRKMEEKILSRVYSNQVVAPAVLQAEPAPSASPATAAAPITSQPTHNHIPKPAAHATQTGEAKNINKPQKTKRSEKSIETMFRIASSNNQRLSGMADNKAHIMITVNSLIISVALGLVVRKLDENRNLIIPTMFMLIVNVVTIIFAVLSTRPKIPNGIFTREQVLSKSVNLLFFGNFYKVKYHEYDWGMKRMMNDKEFLYESLINDLYWHGVILGKKYKLLRTSYSVFMFGIAASMFAYLLAIVLMK